MGGGGNVTETKQITEASVGRERVACLGTDVGTENEKNRGPITSGHNERQSVREEGFEDTAVFIGHFFDDAIEHKYNFATVWTYDITPT